VSYAIGSLDGETPIEPDRFTSILLHRTLIFRWPYRVAAIRHAFPEIVRDELVKTNSLL
jgi:hypothetical protein